MLYIIGVGPGDPSLITVKGLTILRKCHRVLAWRSVADRLKPYLQDRDVLYLTYTNQESLIRLAVSQAELLDICILTHGDPMVSDWELLERVKKAGGRFVVINGVSSVNVALERLGLDLAHVIFLTLHARDPQSLDDVLPLVKKRVLLIFPPPTGVSEMGKALLEKVGNCRVEILQNLTLNNESRWSGDLIALENLGEISDLSIMAVDCRHA